MNLKNLFISIMKNDTMNCKGIDTSASSLGDLFEYIFTEYGHDVKNIAILEVDDVVLDDILKGDDINLRVIAALTKIDNAIPHLELKSRV